MLHRISDFLIAVVDYIPALFLEEDSPNFRVVRAMCLLIVVPLLIAAFALAAHFRLKVVAHLKRSSLRNVSHAANSNPPNSPPISEQSHSAKVQRVP